MPGEHPLPEWSAENINRKRGDTTLETCGWCEYTAGGSCRYDAMLETSCSLMPGYDNKTLYWDTACIWKEQGRSDIEAAVLRKSREAEGHRIQAQRADKSAGLLRMLSEKAEHIPPQPGNREACHFNEGDKIRAFCDGRWTTGTVVMGYRHHDGCVSWVVDGEPVNPNGPIGCGFAVPSVMLESEAKYFVDHPEQFQQWLQRADRSYNGSRLPMAEMLAAFTQEAPSAR